MKPISFKRHRFPADVIRQAVWLYFRFSLSFRDVEELMAARGVDVSYETIRCWTIKFGPLIARRLKKRRSAAVAALAPGRGGLQHRRQADVSVASRRRRRRGPRRPGPAPAGHRGGIEAAQAAPSQPAGGAADDHDGRPGVIRRGSGSAGSEASASTGPASGEQSD